MGKRSRAHRRALCAAPLWSARSETRADDRGVKNRRRRSAATARPERSLAFDERRQRVAGNGRIRTPARLARERDEPGATTAPHAKGRGGGGAHAICRAPPTESDARALA